MAASSFFQQAAVSKGYISKPILTSGVRESSDFANENTESQYLYTALVDTPQPEPGMFSTPQQYNAALRRYAELKQKVSKLGGPSPEMFGSAQDYNKALRLYSGIKNEYRSTPAGRNTEEREYKPISPEMKQYSRDYKDYIGRLTDPQNYKYSKDLERVADLNERNQLGSGNPVFQRGTTQIIGANGEVFDVPIAMAQQIAFEQGVGRGRVDVKEKYFGGSEGANYSSYHVAKDHLRKVSNDQVFQGEGAVNENRREKQAKADIRTQYRIAGEGGLDLNYAKERLSVTGAGQKGKTANQLMEEDLSNVRPSSLSLRQSVYGNKGRRLVAETLEDLRKRKPTTSNVPIKETVK